MILAFFALLKVQFDVKNSKQTMKYILQFFFSLKVNMQK